MKTQKLIDRLKFAAELGKAKRVLDIGGQKPFNCPEHDTFGQAYRVIPEAAAEYEILDRDAKEGVKFTADLNTLEGRNKLSAVLKDYQPEVVLCMEILEHLNYPCEVMDRLAKWVNEQEGVLFITLPNNGNWVLNALQWHFDHNFAFFKSLAARFVSRSGLGGCTVEMYPCMQTYQWFWWVAYAVALGQPFNWGFKVTPAAASGS